MRCPIVLQGHPWNFKVTQDKKKRQFWRELSVSGLYTDGFEMMHKVWHSIKHSVKSPRMVDPQGNIWYWGSKWNLHTVCWGPVGCELDTTSVYFGITYVCFIPSRLPVFAVEPQFWHQDFLFCQKHHLKDTYKIFKKFHVGLKFKWSLYYQYWGSCECLPFEVFFSCLCDGLLCKHAGDHSMTTEACSSPHLTCLGLCGMAVWRLNGAICALFFKVICQFSRSHETKNHQLWPELSVSRLLLQ